MNIPIHGSLLLRLRYTSGILNNLNKFDQTINSLFRNEVEMEIEEICIDHHLETKRQGTRSVARPWVCEKTRHLYYCWGYKR